jgi:hypothetical protein
MTCCVELILGNSSEAIVVLNATIQVKEFPKLCMLLRIKTRGFKIAKMP